MARKRRPISGFQLRLLVERRARGRCEYCHAPQRACGYRFHLEHIIPSSEGGSDAPPNRALACAACNLTKTDKTAGTDPVTGVEVMLFNPRNQTWNEHFDWAVDEETIVGLTPTGRATVETLEMNSKLRRDARRFWFEAKLLP